MLIHRGGRAAEWAMQRAFEAVLSLQWKLLKRRGWLGRLLAISILINVPIGSNANDINISEADYYFIDGQPDVKYYGSSGYINACKDFMSTLPATSQNGQCYASITNILNKCSPAGIEYTPTYYYSGTCDGPPVWSSPDAPFGRSIYVVNKSIVDRWHSKPAVCPSFGDPIYPLTGANRQLIDLGISVANFPLEMAYDSRFAAAARIDGDAAASPSESEFFSATFSSLNGGTLGNYWQANFQRALIFQSGGAARIAHAMRGENEWKDFRQEVVDYTTWDATPDVDDRLFGSGSFRYTDDTAMAQEIYFSNDLSSIQYARGGYVNMTYSDSSTPATLAPYAGLLIGITDHFGRVAQLYYDALGRLSRITAPDAGVLQFDYGAGGLNRLTWPDGNTRNFLYDSNFAGLLVGVVDENSSQFAKFSYDGQLRATSTELYGGVNKNSVSFDATVGWYIKETSDTAQGIFWRDHTWFSVPNMNVLDSYGNSVAIGSVPVLGIPRIITRSQPAGSGCMSSTSNLSYDDRGNIISRTDFNDNLSCYAYEAVRNLVTVSVNGMTAPKACPSTMPSYVPSAVDVSHPERKVTTVWHPDWALKAQEAEPKKITTWVYNGQPDPISGGAASCAPSTATLPDGKPIAVLCARYEQATTDTTGGWGSLLR